MTILKSLEIWTAQAVCDGAIAFSIIAFLLHIARPYFERVLARLTLRVAADIWWLTYLVIRDGALFFSAVAGLWVLNLDLMADIKIGLPFVPIATVISCATLLWKIIDDSDDARRVHRIGVMLSCLAAALNAIGYAIVMEGPGSEYRIARSPFWATMISLRSNANSELAVTTFYISAAGLIVIVIVALIASMRSPEARSVRS